MFGSVLSSSKRVRGFDPQNQRDPPRNLIVRNDGGSYLLGTNTSSRMPLYRCSTTQEEMISYLAVCGIRLSNYAYQFDIVTGERCLSDSSEGFILPFYLLKDGFHFSLHPFFSGVLKKYGIALGKLSSLSWWTLMEHFLYCSCRSESPLLSVFQCFYQSKVLTQGPSNSMVYFSVHQVHEPLLKDWALDIHLDHNKFILVKNRLPSSFNFPTNWPILTKSTCLQS